MPSVIFNEERESYDVWVNNTLYGWGLTQAEAFALAAALAILIANLWEPWPPPPEPPAPAPNYSRRMSP